MANKHNLGLTIGIKSIGGELTKFLREIGALSLADAAHVRLQAPSTTRRPYNVTLNSGTSIYRNATGRGPPPMGKKLQEQESPRFRKIKLLNPRP